MSGCVHFMGAIVNQGAIHWDQGILALNPLYIIAIISMNVTKFNVLCLIDDIYHVK